MKIKNKKTIGILFSLLLHLLLGLFAIRMFDQDRYRPTSTKGYTVELVKQPEQPVSQKAGANAAPPLTSEGAEGSQDKIMNTKEEINFKDYTEELARQAALKALAAKEALLKKQELEAKLKAERETKQKAQLEAKKARESKEKALRDARANAKATKDTTPIPKTPDLIGEQKTNTPQKQLIVPNASAPTADQTRPGSGDADDSSTNGNGNAAGTFDLRVIEYGREAAFAINQNIVVPDAYKYTHVTYRAYVILDRNMQFQKMQMIQSTGNQEFDNNIAKALQQTVYPPLPPGANWNQYKNIDFTIH